MKKITDRYRLGGLTIQVQTLHETLHIQCREYRTESEPDFCVETAQPDIDFEREKSSENDRRAGGRIRAFSDGYLETLAVYRKIAEKMPEYNTVLFHGSCVAVDGCGYLFAARSGTGKSTHARLWRELLGERAAMINDDKPLIRAENGIATVFGTPWDGKHRLSSNRSVPLRAICILRRGERNQIRKVTVQEAYPFLLQQVYRPLNPSATAKTLELIDSIAAAVDLWQLSCNMEPEAAQVSYSAMHG